MKRTEIIDQIQTPGSDNLLVGSTVTYVTAPTDLQDNDIPNWKAVKDVASTSLIVNIPAGSSLPFSVTNTTVPGFTAWVGPYKSFKQVLVLDSADNKSINDVVIVEHFTDNTQAAYASLDIYGHPDDSNPEITQDNLIITLYK